MANDCATAHCDNPAETAIEHTDINRTFAYCASCAQDHLDERPGVTEVVGDE